MIDGTENTVVESVEVTEEVEIDSAAVRDTQAVVPTAAVDSSSAPIAAASAGASVDRRPSATIAVGEIYDGKVLKIKPFGAIVTLPNNALGLVHISQIANGFIQDVADVLEPGDDVVVRVVSHDIESGKISLTMKDIPQPVAYDEYYVQETDEDGNVYIPAPVITPAQAASFEEKFKSWQKLSNERIAGINRRNKRGKRR